jgi:1-deoxy-D-xylulose-5-phosphate synthase
MYKLLENINSPEDIKSLTADELKILADDCRNFLVDIMSRTSGHFASSLGVVELTIALHHVFKTPYDQIVWDVGHQAYIHKLLTGRKDQFDSLRKYKGMSGFPKRSESEFDTFGVGHASTSISAGYGMVCAQEHISEQKKVVTVIGDGSMTGGLAFEGLNNAGASNKDFIVIMNDNDHSIDVAVGALNKYLTKIITSKSYSKIKNEVWSWADRHISIGDLIKKYGHKIEEGVISAITPGAIFEQLGFSYYGPIDGHDMDEVVKVLKTVKSYHGPQLIHLITKKGKGYKLAEEDALKYHAISAPFNPKVGVEKKALGSKTPYTQVFADAVEDIVEINDKLVAVTPAMISGAGLKSFSEKHPTKLYDVGIAEGHAVTFCAGLATQGVIPISAIYSTFLQRAYDGIIHDVAIQKLKVIFAIDRAGVVGADGATHHGVFDIAFMRNIPNMVVMVPGHAKDIRNMMYTAVFNIDGPSSIRYPRDGEVIEKDLKATNFTPLEIGKAETIINGNEIAFLAVGTMVQESEKAISKLNELGLTPSLYNMRFVKPLDEQLLVKISKKYKYVLTLEEGTLQGGFGSAVMEYLSDNNLLHDIKLKRIGIEDRFIDHGTREELLKDMNIDSDTLVKTVQQMIGLKLVVEKESK